jgi:hypothetical protein
MRKITEILPSKSASFIIACSSSSDRFSPNSFATCFRLLNDIFPYYYITTKIPHEKLQDFNEG